MKTWLIFSTAAGLFLVGQTASAAGESAPAWISNLTASGILAWYAWHSQTRTIPKLMDDHRQERDNILRSFREETEAGRQACLAEQRHLLEHHQQQVGALVERIGPADR